MEQWLIECAVLRVRDKRPESSGVWLSLARAPGLGPGGRRFESCHPDFKKRDKRIKETICASGSGVEHHLAKVGAAGSNPVSRSFYF